MIKRKRVFTATVHLNEDDARLLKEFALTPAWIWDDFAKQFHHGEAGWCGPSNGCKLLKNLLKQIIGNRMLKAEKLRHPNYHADWEREDN